MAAKKKKEEAEETPAPADAKSRVAQMMASDWMKKVHKKYGEGRVQVASQAVDTRVRRIPTGVFPVDFCLGGGFAAGRVNVVYGKKSAFKTTLMLKTIANAQKLCANCFTGQKGVLECSCGNFRESAGLILDVEGTFDEEWATKLGVDLDSVMLHRPDYGEQGFDIMDATLLSGGCDFVLVDSIAFSEPAAEMTKAVEEDTMGAQARMMGKVIRKLVSAMNISLNETKGRRPTIFMINQLRSKIGVLYGSPEVQSGGAAPGFAASIEANVRAGKVELGEDKYPLLANFGLKTTKNKTFPPYMECEFQLFLRNTEHRKIGDTYDEPFILRQAESLGILVRDGVTWKMCDKDFRKRELVLEEMMANAEYNTFVRDTVMDAMMERF